MIAGIILWACQISILLIVLFLLFWKFYFLRDPKRVIPAGDSIISPADGRINRIFNVKGGKAQISKGMLGKFQLLTSDVADSATIVNIVMTPLDVHIQRAPISGIVKSVRYQKGAFRNAIIDDIAIDNERNEILIKGGNQNIKVVQIAGALARRIECFVKQGQRLKKGDRLGRINLGSQVTLVMPDDLQVAVKVGQKVKGGETIIATR